MAFLTALAGLYGGYQQGRQNRAILNQEQQTQAQTLALEKQRADIEAQKWHAEQEQTTRNRGIDPATNKPFLLPQPLTQIRPNNQGKGGPASLQDYYAHENALAGFYAQQGATDLANLHGATAAEYQRQIQAQQTQQSELFRTMFTQMQENNRANVTDQRQRDLVGQRENFDTQRDAARRAFEVWLRNNPDAYHRFLMSDKSPQAALKLAQSELSKIQGGVDATLRQMTLQSSGQQAAGHTVANPNMDAMALKLHSAMKNILAHPDQADGTISKIMGDTSLSEGQRTMAVQAISRAAAAATAAKQATQMDAAARKAAEQPGGSYDNQNPPSPWP